MSRAYLAGDCLLGAIFGTGTNGAYVEDINAIKKLSPEIRTALGPHVTKMIINGEWGAFDNAVSESDKTTGTDTQALPIQAQSSSCHAV